MRISNIEKSLWFLQPMPHKLSRNGPRLSIQGLFVRIPAQPISFLTFDKSNCDNSLCEKATSCLESMLCEVLVKESQETYEEVNWLPGYDWKIVENGVKSRSIYQSINQTDTCSRWLLKNTGKRRNCSWCTILPFAMMFSTFFHLCRDFPYFSLDIFKVICCRFVVWQKGLSVIDWQL